jgi:predicted Zn-dependent protease
VPGYNLDVPTVLRIAAIFLVGLTSAPFVAALVLWQSARLLRFRTPSYKMSLVSVLTALAATAVVEALLFRFGWTARPRGMLRESSVILAVGLGTGLISGVISVAKLFNESVWKSLAAVVLQLMSAVLVLLIVAGAMVYTALSHARPIRYVVREIRVVPIGDVPPEDTGAIRDIIHQEFPAMTVAVEDPMALPATAFDRARRQYDADALLNAVLARPGDPQSRSVGVTAGDVFSPGLPFVFSTARPGGRAAVVSVARLQSSDEALVRERYRKIVLRALGLTFGFGGTQDTACLMTSAASLRELDAQGEAWCGREPEILQKIQGIK